MKKKALLVVNADWFFLSHRLPIGRALREAGWDVTVAAGDTGVAHEIRAAGLSFVPLAIDRGGRSLTRDGRLLAAIAALYRRERPNIVHHVTIKPVLYGSLAAQTLGIPAINALSGLGYVFTERAGTDLRQRALREAVRAAYRVALRSERARCVFQNPDDRAVFVDGRLVRAERTVIIPGSGVDTERFRPTPLPDGPPLVVVPARLLRDKGIVELVEAARLLRARGVVARFALVGPLDLHNPAAIAERIVRGWVDEGVVEWWGHRADMEAVYAAAHLVVLPSYREGRPLALIEAASSGRAVVTCDVPGCRGVDRAELARRGARGRAIVLAEMSLEVVLRATLALYDELTSLRRDYASVSPSSRASASPSRAAARSCPSRAEDLRPPASSARRGSP